MTDVSGRLMPCRTHAEAMQSPFQFFDIYRIMNIALSTTFLSAVVLAAFLFVACNGDGEAGKEPDSTAVTGNPTGQVGLDSIPSPDTVSGVDTSIAALGAEVPGGRYGVKSGIIEMKSVSEPGRAATFYFDDYGGRIATYVTITDSLNSQPLIIRQVMVMANGWSTFYDANHKVGMKSRMLERTLNYYPDFDSMSAETRAALKYEEAPPKTIIGRQTQGHSIMRNGMRSNVWTWKGIPLRTESASLRGTWAVFEATSLQTDVPVPAEKFEIPSDVKISEVKTTPRLYGE